MADGLNFVLARVRAALCHRAALFFTANSHPIGPLIRANFQLHW
jgi:hypothetical protein